MLEFEGEVWSAGELIKAWRGVALHSLFWMVRITIPFSLCIVVLCVEYVSTSSSRFVANRDTNYMLSSERCTWISHTREMGAFQLIDW